LRSMKSPQPRKRSSWSIAPQQHHAGRRATAGGDDGCARLRDLTITSLASELSDRFVEEAEAVRATLGQLASVRVHGQLAVERDPASPVEPILCLAEAAESECFDPGDGVEGEPVVDEREIDVGRPQTRPRPQVRRLT